MYMRHLGSTDNGCMLKVEDLCTAEMVQPRKAGKVQTASWAQLPQVCMSLPGDIPQYSLMLSSVLAICSMWALQQP